MALRRRNTTVGTSGIDPASNKVRARDRSINSQGVYHTNTVVNSDVPLSNTIKFIGGKSMHVKRYYSQLLGSDNSPILLDINVTRDLQQYQSIDNLELKVLNALDIANAEDVSGTANMAVDVIPQEMDMFTMTVANDRQALMKVTKVNKGHYNNNNVYTIEYVIDSFKDESPERFDNIESKVMREYVYDDNYNISYTNPIITPKAYEAKVNIERLIKTLQIDIIRSGLNREYNILTVPHKDFIIVDPVHTDFIFKVIPYDIPQMDIINNPYYGLDMVSTYNIWSAILDKNIDGVYLLDNTTILFNRNGRALTPFITNSVLVDFDSGDALRTSQVPENMLPRFDVDDYSYLFTKNFYDIDFNVDNLSLIERLTIRYLNNEDHDLDGILQMMKVYRYWTPLEKFYYLPVLLALATDVISKNPNNYL